MELLAWSPYSGATTEELTEELRSLHDHLARWSADRPDPGILPALLAFLEKGSITNALELAQTFLPAVAVLRLTLSIDGAESVGVFLRQRVARGLPPLWPIADTANNLYEFFDAIPGVLDMHRANVIGYGLFFANEAITGGEGRFTFYRDFASLSEDAQREIRGNVAALIKQPPTEVDDDNPDPLPFLRRIAAHLDHPAGAPRPTDFERLGYSREHDEYLFSVFTTYADQVFAARLTVNRATGQPEMREDIPLGAVPAEPPHTRLPAVDVSGALKLPLATPEPSRPASPLSPITPVDAAAILESGAALVGRRVTGNLDLVRSAALASITVKDCAIDGSVGFERLEVTQDVTFERVVIGGSLHLDASRIGGLLSLERVTAGGSIDLSDAEVGRRVQALEVRAETVWARHLNVVRGAVHIGPTEAEPDAAGLITGSQVNLNGSRASSGFKITASQIGGPLLMMDCRTTGSIQLGSPLETRMLVRARLDLSGSTVGADVAVRGVHVGTDFVMTGCTVEGRLHFGSPTRETVVAGQDCTIARDLALTSSVVKGALTLGGLQVQGTLRLERCTLGSVITEGRIVWDRAIDRVATLCPTVIRNGIEIFACQIPGEVRLGLLLADERYAGRFAFEMVSTTVGQGVTFWDEGMVEPRTTAQLGGYLDELVRIKVKKANPGEPEQRRRTRWIIGGFEHDARHPGWPVSIAAPHEESPGPPPRSLVGETSSTASDEISVGELEGHLSARRVFSEIRGDLRLALCKIGGDLSLANLKSRGNRIVVEGLTVQGDLAADWKGRRYAAPAEAWAQPFVGLLATMGGVLDVSGTTVLGEARLAGLRLTGPGGGRGAALAIQYSKIEGVVSLADAVTRELPAARSTLAGDIDVSWSTVDHLVLDGRSLGAGSTTPPNRLVATNATIRKLELRDPLPGEVDLADAKVMVWDFGPVEGNELFARFANVLSHQRPFKRNVYQEVEAYLHNSGFEDLAKRVHMDLVTRQRRHAISQARHQEPGWRARWSLVNAWRGRLAGAINWFMTGNFTSEWRPIVLCWLPVWLGSSCYFADPARIAVGPSYRSTFADHPESVCRTLDHWGFAESMKFTTRYVLPVVPSVGMDELEAGDALQSHPVCLGASNRIQNEGRNVFAVIRHGLDWTRPSTFATWARLLSWLFLSLATGTIFAEDVANAKGSVSVRELPISWR